MSVKETFLKRNVVSPSHVGGGYDVVYLGGGPTGIMAAEAINRHLGRNGRAIVFEQGNRFGGSGSGASLANLRTIQPHPELSKAVQATGDWARHHLGDDSIVQFPYLYIATTQGELDNHAQNLHSLQAEGFGKSAQILPPGEVHQRYPFIDREIAGALLWPDAGMLPLESMLDKAISLSDKTTFNLNTKVEKIVVKNGRVVGVRTDKGTVATDTVVVCSGPFAMGTGINDDDKRPSRNFTKDLVVRRRRSFEAEITGLPVNGEFSPQERNVFVVTPEGYARYLGLSDSGDGNVTYGWAEPSRKLRQSELVNNPPTNPNDGWADRVYSHLGRVISGYNDREVHGRVMAGQFVTRPRISAGYYASLPGRHTPVICEHPEIKGLFLDIGYEGEGVMLMAGGAEVLEQVLFDSQHPVEHQIYSYGYTSPTVGNSVGIL